MRTTLTIDDDVYQAVGQIAQASGRRLGQVLSELARRGLRPNVQRFPTFNVPKGASVITAAHVQRLLDAENDLVALG